MKDDKKKDWDHLSIITVMVIALATLIGGWHQISDSLIGFLGG